MNAVLSDQDAVESDKKASGTFSRKESITVFFKRRGKMRETFFAGMGENPHEINYNEKN